MHKNDLDGEDATIYRVVVNQEEQYSIWPEYKENPPGWMNVGKVGPKAECLDYIKEVWTDLRPLSLRKRMEEMARNHPQQSQSPEPGSCEKNLVDILCEGYHAVEASLRPERSVKLFKEEIDRDYVHVKFTGTKGGTELGVRLDRSACNFGSADFEQGKGIIDLEGELTLDYVNVRCVAKIDLKSLAGKGYLVRVG